MKTKLLFLSVIAAISLAGCGSKNNSSEQSKSNSESSAQSQSVEESSSSSKEASSESSKSAEQSSEKSSEQSTETSSIEQSSEEEISSEATTSSEEASSEESSSEQSSEELSSEELSSEELSSEEASSEQSSEKESSEESKESSIEESSEELSSEQSSSSEESGEAPINFDYSDQDYLDFFNHGNKVDVTINIKNDVIYNLAQYGQSYFDHEEMYHPCDVVIKINDEVRFEGEEVGLRMKGNTSKDRNFVDENGHFNSRVHFKMSFKETFNDPLDNDYYSHDWSSDAAGLKARKKRRFGGMKKVDFKWNRNYDNTFTKEAYSKYIYRDAGVLAQNINLVKFTINTESDSFTDVYQVLECVDGNMLEKYYGSAGGDGNLYKGLYARANLTTDSISGTNLDPESSYNTNPTYPLKTNDDGPTYDHTLMRNFVNEINKKNVSASAMETTLKDIMEVDNVIRYCAIAWVVGNPDDLRNNANNTYFYFNSINDHFSIIPYDDDRCFGIHKDWPVDMSTLPADSSRMQGMSYNQGGKVWLNNPLLWRIVCEDSSYKDYPLVKSFNDLYRSYVVEFANKYLDAELFKSFTDGFYYAPSKDINNAGQDNITFANYAQNKLNNMFKA